MKFGVNTFVWVSPCTTSAIKELAPKVKQLGFDVFEISIENPELLDINEVKNELDRNGLQAIVCGAFGPDRNICSTDPQIIVEAKIYIRWLIEAAERPGLVVVCGSMYSSVNKEHLTERSISHFKISLHRIGNLILLLWLNRFQLICLCLGSPSIKNTYYEYYDKSQN